MKIKEFCEIRAGYAFRRRLASKPGGNVIVVQPKDISSEGVVSFGNEGPLHTDTTVSRPLQRGDVLVVNRCRFAATVFNLSEASACIAPSSILILTIKDARVLPEYVAVYFNSLNGQKLFRRHFEKTTVPFISTSNLGNMDIPVPPLDKQRSLIGFDAVAKKYARQTLRKRELLRLILGHELRNAERSMNGRRR